MNIIANTKRLRMLPAATGFDMESLPCRLLVIGSRSVRLPLALTDAAHVDIAEHCGIPRKFYFRLLEQAPQLHAYLVNALFELEPADRCLMHGDGYLRGVCSPKRAGTEITDVWIDEADSIPPGRLP